MTTLRLDGFMKYISADRTRELVTEIHQHFRSDTSTGSCLMSGCRSSINGKATVTEIRSIRKV